jgi:hypothetical protein
VHFQKDVLSQVVHLRAVLYHPVNHGVDEVLVPLHELAEGAVVTPLATRHQLALVEFGHQPSALERRRSGKVSLRVGETIENPAESNAARTRRGACRKKW